MAYRYVQRYGEGSQRTDPVRGTAIEQARMRTHLFSAVPPQKHGKRGNVLTMAMSQDPGASRLMDSDAPESRAINDLHDGMEPERDSRRWHA